MTQVKSFDLSDPVRRALLDLLDEKAYNEIQVVEIAQRAGIARQTFYKRFPSKDELLLGFMDDVFDEFLEEIQEDLTRFPATAEKVFQTLYEHWASYYEVLLKVLEAGIDDLVYRRFRRYITRVVGNVSRTQEIQIKDPQMTEYFIEFFAGGSYQAIVRWMKSEMPYSPKMMGLFMATMMRMDLLSITSDVAE